MNSKKSVLVTGCSAGGVGSALAHALAKRGHHVIATARDISKIPDTVSTLDNVTTLQLDVTSEDSVAKAVQTVTELTKKLQEAEGLDVLVNNAGSGYTMPLLDVDLEVAKKVYDTNLWGVLRVIKAFAELLVKRRGRVFNVSSVGGEMHTPWIGKNLTESFPNFHVFQWRHLPQVAEGMQGNVLSC